MEEIVKIAAIAIVTSLLTILLKRDNPIGAYLVTAAALVVIIIFAVNLTAPIVEFLSGLSEAAGVSPAILAPLLKVLGISIVTKIAAETCRDAGQQAVAAYTEIAGQAAALYVSLPLLSAVLAMVKSFLS